MYIFITAYLHLSLVDFRIILDFNHSFVIINDYLFVNYSAIIITEELNFAKFTIAINSIRRF